MFFRNNYFGSHSFFMSYHFCKIFVHLLIVAAVSNFIIFILIGRDLANICLFKVNSRNIRKRCGVCSKLTIKTAGRRSGVFIVNYEHITSFSSVAFVRYEQVNVCHGVLSCVNIITQSIKMSRCFI